MSSLWITIVIIIMIMIIISLPQLLPPLRSLDRSPGPEKEPQLGCVWVTICPSQSPIELGPPTPARHRPRGAASASAHGSKRSHREPCSCFGASSVPPTTSSTGDLQTAPVVSVQATDSVVWNRKDASNPLVGRIMAMLSQLQLILRCRRLWSAM
ncbi:hypothetical protein LZ30DRAFT_709180 [Colletotrichum cereale]|nr:hypothetical protein LZ30DRAFT_709180 [Colletotrichum cereale]